MRIRQVRPEFFTDPLTARLSIGTRLIYIGLWCVADDAGWLRWDLSQLAVLILPYESVHRREDHIAKARDELVTASRIELLDCGCAVIPTLPRHQRINGTKAYTCRDWHDKHCVALVPDVSGNSRTRSPVTVGNGRERNGTVDAREAHDFKAKVQWGEETR
jgi:hypothetical protein